MRVLGLVPARGGSRRLADKNLQQLGGRTLVRRALDTAASAAGLGTVALSSEDPRILHEADGVESVVAIARPTELASHSASSYDVVMHSRQAVEELTGQHFDAIALLQCTSPFTAPEDIDGAIELMERARAGSVLTVTEADMAYHPTKLRRLVGDRLVPYTGSGELVPSHELEGFWVNNGSVYLSRRDTLDAGSLVSADVRALPMPRRRSHDIDTLEDLEYAHFLVERYGDRAN